MDHGIAGSAGVKVTATILQLSFAERSKDVLLYKTESEPYAINR